METLSNVASSVSKAVFGESTTEQQRPAEEPISGKTGTGTADEPYDQGNAGDDVQEQVQQSGEEPISGETGKGTVEVPFDQGNAPGNIPLSRMS